MAGFRITGYDNPSFQGPVDVTVSKLPVLQVTAGYSSDPFYFASNLFL